ncbi:glycosyltransferase family 2 protein [Helicobacter sp. 11-8110]|uniref:glycosyltransferase family 2 protein n=1 Tax=Helicobacter sp. 11-8110 TaxID=2004997 RepID=UPI000DCBD41E|nr:glycosyltransferase family 2 protein [Helicobacter sp. 11-8110]RAX52295.1 hypothetical protein CCY98_04795 [Helicobacter sp. 11-8110]
MFFTITVATYNRSNLLKRCLNSIKKQTFNDYEVIILDDCSSDDTPIVVQEYTNDKRFRYIRFEKNLGFANKTFYEAQKKGCFNGKYIFECADDDFLNEEYFLENVYTAIKDEEVDVVLFDVGWCYFDDIVMKCNIDTLPKLFHYNDLNEAQKSIVTNKMMNILKKEWIEQYDFFNEETQECKDVYFEYSNELIFKYARLGYVPHITYIGGISPNARAKYIDLYQWIVTMGMYFDGAKQEELVRQKLYDIFMSPAVCQNVLVNWHGKEVADILYSLVGKKKYSKYLRDIAKIYSECFQDELNREYDNFNRLLLNEKETLEIIDNSNNFVVYSDGFMSHYVQEYLIRKNKKILFVADDYKEGFLGFQEIIKKKQEIDVVFIATSNIIYIRDMLLKLSPICNEVNILTLILRDDTWRMP